MSWRIGLGLLIYSDAYSVRLVCEYRASGVVTSKKMCEGPGEFHHYDVSLNIASAPSFHLCSKKKS